MVAQQDRGAVGLVESEDGLDHALLPEQAFGQLAGRGCVSAPRRPALAPRQPSPAPQDLPRHVARDAAEPRPELDVTGRRVLERRHPRLLDGVVDVVFAQKGARHARDEIAVLEERGGAYRIHRHLQAYGRGTVDRFSYAVSNMEAFLSERLGRPVQVAYGSARTAPVQVVHEASQVRVRLHGFFRGAPADVREALAAWMRAGKRARRACDLLDGWIDAQLAELPPPRPRRVRLDPRGRCHDLEALADPLYEDEFLLDFEDSRRPGLTWGRRIRSRARRGLQLGSYEHRRRVVRVHPVLDQPVVPQWFVRYLLFHEILHAALPGEVHHGPAFRVRERAYPDYPRAVRWQRSHIDMLVRSARRNKPARRQGWLF